MQEQILEQQQEEARKGNLIPIEEFMPRWTAFKEQHGDGLVMPHTEDVFGISFTDGTACLIGEAHGFGKDNLYGGCPTCNHLSYQGLKDGSALKARNGTVRDFYEFKERVYNHFYQSHPEKLVRS